MASNRNELENHESPEVRAIRDALGAIAMAEPAVYWVYCVGNGDWNVRREGDVTERSYPNRELALASVRLAVVRCASYRVFLQCPDGNFVKECFNWLPRHPPAGAEPS